MGYEPEGVVENVGDALGIFTARVQRVCEDFKEFIEQRGNETGGWRGTVHDGRREPSEPPGGTPGMA
jgi:hypothetical protein